MRAAGYRGPRQEKRGRADRRREAGIRRIDREILKRAGRSFGPPSGIWRCRGRDPRSLFSPCGEGRRACDGVRGRCTIRGFHPHPQAPPARERNEYTAPQASSKTRIVFNFRPLWFICLVTGLCCLPLLLPTHRGEPDAHADCRAGFAASRRRNIALRARWDVLAFHLEMPTEEVCGLVRQFQPLCKQHA